MNVTMSKCVVPAGGRAPVNQIKTGPHAISNLIQADQKSKDDK